MKEPKRQHLMESVNRFQKRDPQLHEELHRKMSTRSAEAAFPAAKVVAQAYDELPIVSEDIRRIGESDAPDLENPEVTAYERRVAETIVRPSARPVLIIRQNKVTTEFMGPSDSEVWTRRINSARSILDAVIPSVGRVEVKNNPVYTWLGTGWLVAEDIIVTNRHVAREFGRNGSSGFVFRLGVNRGLQSAQLDFLEEFQRSASQEFVVETILWIASPNEPDVAYLRVKRPAANRPLPRHIPLAESVSPDDFVVTIGYPARDPRVPDQELVKRVFGDVYEKKRLAPGQVTDVGPEEIQHDCSTLGGNSGSPVINLKTGEAVGLHFSGLFLEANFAVSAPKVRELLQKVQRAELPGMGPIEISTKPIKPFPSIVTSAPVAAAGLSASTYSFQFQIPIEITVKVGGAVGMGTGHGDGNGNGNGNGSISTGTTGSNVSFTGDPAHFNNALRAAQQALAGQSDVIEVRPGYRFKRGWITDERVIVVEVKKKLTPIELRMADKAMIPSQFDGVPVDVRTAALMDQLEHLGIDLEALEGLPKPGMYQEPLSLSLDPVKEPMDAIFHVSPDSGFPNLKAFLGRVRKHMTATMYEWEAEHISDAIEAAIKPGNRKLKMVTQKAGTEGAVEDMKNRLGSNAKFQHVWASVGSGKIVPTAYHIKVASRDGEELWLSSGNWKDSNQANIDPAGQNLTTITPLRQHNREWHAIIKNAKLAQLFQKYIEFDFDEAKRIPVEEGLELAVADQFVFVPEAAFVELLERRVRAHYFDPLSVTGRDLEVQPLLTPDRDAHGRRKFIDFATKMVRKGTRKIYLQNQSFNLLEENVDEFEQFFGALKDKQNSGVDVRIIFRDGREFGGDSGQKQQKLLERLKDFGFNTDQIRVQMRCHTKGIIVDPPDEANPNSGEVLLGSQNLTNQGALFNRDASLLVRDAEVTRYFEQIFLFDWENLATQEIDELVGGMRLAQPDDETPAGYRRVSVRELLGLV